MFRNVVQNACGFDFQHKSSIDMGHKTYLQNWCGDLAVLIPDEIADELGLTDGTNVTLSLVNDGLTIRRQISSEERSEMFAPDEQPENEDTG